ncbi:MAG: PorV/PorQ family protein [Bacteroidota bacterium]|nr:PorV/PorQ family protein [Bacteroidota bacterium]
MEKIRKQSLLIFACLFIISAITFAGNKNRQGTAGAQELLIPVGARGMALGSSAIANASGIDAIYWNPAGIVRTESSVEAMFSQMQYIADIGVAYGALNVNAGSFGNLAFTIKSVSFGDIPRTTEDFPDGTGETFSPTFVTTGITYGRLLNDRISVGVTFNLIAEQIMSTSATGMGINAGVQYSGLAIPELKFGIAVKNIGPNMSYNGSNLYRFGTIDADRDAQYYKVEAASFELPTTMEIGLAYEKKFGGQHNIMFSSTFQNNNYSTDEYKFGGEYGYNNLLFVRGGYNVNPEADKDAQIFDYTFGFGLNFDLAGTVVGFDYAYRHTLFFDANSVVTVTLGF